jgi:hypothetical protein
MNAPDKSKKKFTFFIHKDVFKIYEQIAKDESEKLGRTVTVPELLRRDSLERANSVLKKKGKRLLDLDPSAGKFASAGPNSVAQVIIRPGGRIEAYNKKGDRLREWKHLNQLEEITRLYRRVKVAHEMATQERKTA